jgi:hypothetical protein
MPSIPRLIGKLRRGLHQPTSHLVSTEQDREAPLGVGEIVAASSYLDLGGLPLEYWPGYRHAAKDEQDH